MQESTRITSWLQHLRILMPPKGVILVGAGTGTGQWTQLLQEWNVPKATLVEADDAQFKHLQSTIAQHDDWKLLNEVMAACTGTVDYHHASNSSESGLLEPESLRKYWPSIQSYQKQTRQAATLADLQQGADTLANWLLVDCLPALPIIEGAGDQIHAFDIIVVRILLDDKAISADLTSQTALMSYLGNRGYSCLSTEPERHPAIGHALFVRNNETEIRNLRQQITYLAQTNNAQERELARCQEAYVKATEEQKRQVNQLTEANVITEKLATERLQQVEQLTREKNTAEKLAVERLQQVEQLTREKNTAEKLAVERLQKLEASAKSQVEITKIATDKAAAEKIAADRQIKIDTLEKQVKLLQETEASTKQRQQILRDELTSAEAQIELIKELLLREDTL